MADLNNNGIEDEMEELSAEEALELGLINADGSLVPAPDSNMVAQVPGIENIRNPGAFNPANMETVEPVGPPTTVGESISQTYNESVLADLVNKGFGQEAFQSQAPDGTPTYSIYNKRFGTLGSQVPYSEAGPEAKAQAMNFMLETGGQERPLPETPTSPVRTPEQVQSILDEYRAEQATQTPAAASTFGATPSVTPPVESLSGGAQGQGMDMNQQAIVNAQGQEATVPPPAQTLSQFMRYEDSPEQRTEQFVDEQGRMRFRPTQEALRLQGQGMDMNQQAITNAQLQGQGAAAQTPVAALSSFEKDSLARQQRIGGTGSFEGDSAAREARLRAEERQPGETQTQRDTRVAQSRTTGGQTVGLSFDDARRRARGQLAERGIDDASASMVNDLARGLQAGEPERLAKLQTAQAEKNRPEFEGKVYTINGVTFAQTSNGGAQVIDTGTETSEESTAKMKDFVFALEQIDKARKAYQAGDIDKANDIFTAAEIQKDGFATNATEYFKDSITPAVSTPSVTDSGLTQQQESGIQNVMATNGITREDAIKALKEAGKLK